VHDFFFGPDRGKFYHIIFIHFLGIVSEANMMEEGRTRSYTEEDKKRQGQFKSSEKIS
jgi:hypothetical protein